MRQPGVVGNRVRLCQQRMPHSFSPEQRLIRVHNFRKADILPDERRKL